MRVPITKFFPVANHEMTKAAACMFTTTPDSHFIVDLHPKFKQVGCVSLHYMMPIVASAWGAGLV